jgi:hypothetical protein
MIGIFRAAVLALLAFGSATVTAQQRVVDLGVTANVTMLPVSPGTVGEIEFTVTNHGPDVALIPTLASSYYLAGFAGQQIALGATERTPPCLVHYLHGDPPEGLPADYWAYLWYDELAPGQSATCVLGVYAFPAAAGVLPMTFSVFDGGYAPSLSVTDQNPDNDTVAVALNFGSTFTPPEVIPAGSHRSLGTLLLVVLVAGMLAMRARGRASAINR